MENNEHYYGEGYSIETDPYAMPNGVLINKLGITSTRELDEIEQDISSLAIKLLSQEAPPERFDFAHLRNLHKRIFEQVYPWAGELRTVDIGKGDTLFLRHQDLETEAQKLFDALEQTDFKNLSVEEFSQTIGEFFIALNHIHPFREGNGRTQLELTRFDGHLIVMKQGVQDAKKSQPQAAISGAISPANDRFSRHWA
jgi:cell filamentation protein